MAYGDGDAPCEITIEMPAKSATAAETRKLDGHHTNDNRTIMVIDHGGCAYAIICAPGVTRKKALQHIVEHKATRQARALEPEPEALDEEPDDNDGFGN